MQKRSESTSIRSEYDLKEENGEDIEVIVPIVDLSRPTAMDLHYTGNANIHLYIADSKRLTIEKQGKTFKIAINFQVQKYIS